MHQINPLLLGLGNIFESLAKGVPLTSSATSQTIGCFQQLDSKSLLLLNTILTYIIKQRNQAAAQPEASPSRLAFMMLTGTLHATRGKRLIHLQLHL